LFLSNDPALSQLYTLSLHDALPISSWPRTSSGKYAMSSAEKSRSRAFMPWSSEKPNEAHALPRSKFEPIVNVKSARSRSPSLGEIGRARLNSSHVKISYAVFCLKKK